METNNYNEANHKQHKIMSVFGITRFQKSTLIKHGNKQERSKPQTTQNNVRVWHRMCQWV